MNLSEQTSNGVVVIVLDGRIDTEGAVALEEALRARLEADQYRIVLDMGGVQYVNSAALRSLAEAILTCRAQGGDLKLAALQPRVRRVLQIVGFDRYSAIYETQQAALADF
ncbi:MAG: STAS domain-containing protein [Anaerolineae bacterium]|nr:STAS domain-containing protein [Anaerolineae bacterium]